MAGWVVLKWSLLALGFAGSLFALHRLLLRLEARGYVYYLHKKPSGGALGGFVAFQRAIEPGTEHIRTVHQERSRREGEGSGAPPIAGERNKQDEKPSHPT